MKSLHIILLFLAVVLVRVSSFGLGPAFFVNVNSLTRVLRTSDLEKRGWEMVFRATSGTGESVYDAWIRGTHTTNRKPATMRRSNAQHYRNPIVNNWSTLGIKHVKFAFYTEDKEVAHVIFNGKFSDRESWFDQRNVQYSSWPDLRSNQNFNFFSIDGDRLRERRFLINRSYGGCPNDNGYMAVINAKKADCHWDHQPAYPQFIYSRFTTSDFWDRRMFGVADYMAIFINKRSLY